MALTKERIVAAALEILDTWGLADLTMRRLADAVGVRVSALYWHVPNKQSLLAAVADAMVVDIAAPLGGMPWREALLGWSAGLRGALVAHRDAAELVAAARASGLTEVDLVAAPRAILAAAGLADGAAEQAAHALVHLVLGHVAAEQARAEWLRLAGSPAAGAGSDLLYGVGLLVDGVGVQLG